MIGFREIKMLVTRIFRSLQPEIRTHLIGQVVSYDSARNTAEIQPVVSAVRFRDAGNLTTKQLPVLKDVPVKLPGSGKGWLAYTPAVGTYGVLHIADREIETWLSQGGLVDPATLRLHDLSDAIFEPSILPLVDDGDNGLLAEVIEDDRISLRTRTNTTAIAVLYDETVEIKNEKCTITIDVDGNVTLETEGDISAESTAGDAIVTASGNVTTSATETVIQDGTDYAVQYTAMKSAFDTLKSELNALVTAYNAHIHITTATVGATPTPGVIAPTLSTGTPPTADMSGAQVSDVRLP